MPARTRRTKVRKKRRTVKSRNKKQLLLLRKLLMFLLGVITLSVVISILRSNTTYWNSTKKLSVVYPRENGDIEVVVFDPRLQEITSVVVPGETEIATAYSLGVWKTKSLWQLGVNENLGGRLLSDTVTNHLRLPTEAWADDRFKGFVQGNSRDAFKAALYVRDTNLSLRERISLLMFSTRVNNSGYKEISLANTSYLQQTTLEDGTEGYTTFANLPQEIGAIFSANEFSGREVTVAIHDVSGVSSNIADEMSKVIEVLGAKVALVSDDTDYPERIGECLIKGSDKESVSVINGVFRCDEIVGLADTSFDIEITISKDFIERF